MRGKCPILIFLGIIVVVTTLPGEEATVYVTPQGKTYHTSDCRYYSESCIPLTIAEALYSGYIPCGSCRPPQESTYPAPSYTIEPLALPFCEHPDDVVVYKGFALLYCEEYEQPAWIAYMLTAEEEAGTLSRPNNFRPDPNIPTGSAVQADYDDMAYTTETGAEPQKYARGHLAPHADMDWDFLAASQSYLFSNMSPQVPEFNGSGGLWYRLEEWQRKQASSCGAVYIVSGPIITDGPYDTIGPNDVAVPKRYFKVILDFMLPGLKAVGFIVPNERNIEPLSAFAVSVDEVEAVTGLDFFYILDDDLEASLESRIWGNTESSDVLPDMFY